jgi:hypothetical protein
VVKTERQGARRAMTRDSTRAALVVTADEQRREDRGGHLRNADWTIRRLTPGGTATTASADRRGHPYALAQGLGASVRGAASEMAASNALVCVLPPESPGLAFGDVNRARWTETARAHVALVARGCAGAIPQLRAAGGGSIVIVCSNSGLDGAAAAADIGSPNAAVIGVMKCPALEPAPARIAVNTAVAAPWRADGSHQGAAAVGGAVRYLTEEAS